MAIFDKFRKKKEQIPAERIDIDARFIRPDDFRLGQNSSTLRECRFTVTLWGEKCNGLAAVESPEDYQSVDVELAQCCADLKSAVSWLQSNKARIQQALVDDAMLETAIDWAEGCETVEEDGKQYYRAEDGLIPRPVSREHFLGSILAKEFSLFSYAGDEAFSLTLYLITRPDYFSYHAIQVSIDVPHGLGGEGYSICVDGLVG